MTVPCPSCDRDGFTSTRAMKVHHTKVHGESIAGVEYTCDYCGDTGRRIKAKLDAYEGTYCNKECRAKDKRVEVSKSELYELYWGDGLTTREVAEELGGSQGIIQRRMVEYGIPRRNESDTVASFVFKHRSREWKQREYVEKGKSIYQLARENNVWHEWVRRQLHQEGINLRNNWFTDRHSEDELERLDYNYGGDWEDIRQDVLDRDNHTCQGCATPEDELERPLEAHHIQGFRTFADSENANELENLVALCRTCHNRWETLPVKPTLSD